MKLPGFHYDSRRKKARFEFILPGSASKKRLRQWISGVTRDDALEKWREFREKALAGQTKVDPVTFQEYISKFGSVISARLSERTRELEDEIVRRHLLPFFGLHRLDRINAALVRDFAGILRRDGYEAVDERGTATRRPYSATVINRSLSVLRKYLRDAVDREVLDAYPIRGRMPREKEAPLRLEMSREELVAFLSVFDDEDRFRRHLSENRSRGQVVTSEKFGGQPRVFGGGRRPDGEAAGILFERFRAFKPVLVVALETGLRKSDLLALRWRDVHLDTGMIRVAMQKTKGEAEIPISTACREALLELKERPVVSDRVFLGESGRPLSSETLGRNFELAKKLAGISRRLRFHDLRHTFGSRLATGGVSLQVIAKALGHTSARMSERYARPSDEAFLSVTSALDSSRTNSPANSPTTEKAALSSGQTVNPCGSVFYMERDTRVELATSTLARASETMAALRSALESSLCPECRRTLKLFEEALMQRNEQSREHSSGGSMTG